MSLQRVRFASSGAPGTWTELPINPMEADLQDTRDQTLIRTLDGDTVLHLSEHDSRVRTLTWRNFEKDHTTFSSLLATLNNYNSQVFYINYGDLDYRQQIVDTWNKVRCVDVQIKIRPGGKVKYDSVQMLLTPSTT